ncbi:MAG: NinG protein [Caudoviricetes sp.]|nr:MAG: NinG protein [Caudoviricetes sp.]
MRQKADRAETARRKEAIKTIPQLTREAQIAFNAYIRARDQAAGYPCISSSRPLDWSGNAVDAGHFRSTGAAPHLRFNEDNCHAQSKFDNLWRAGNAVDYRIKLIERIGLERVEALESDNGSPKWTRQDLIDIRAKYREKLRQLKNN